MKENLYLFKAEPAMLETIIKPILEKFPTLKNVSTQSNLSSFLNELNNEMNKIVSLTDSTIKRIERMKNGSYATINQITTISKQRIFDPVNPYSSLNEVVLPDEYIGKIDQKIGTFFLNNIDKNTL